MAGSGLKGVPFELSSIVEERRLGAVALRGDGSCDEAHQQEGSNSERSIGDVGWLSMMSSRCEAVVRSDPRHG